MLVYLYSLIFFDYSVIGSITVRVCEYACMRAQYVCVRV